MRRGISSLIFILIVAGGAAFWLWTRGNAPAQAVSQPVLTTRPVPAEGWGPMRVMTANIRLSEPNDGENQWINRRNGVVRIFLKYEPEIIACQEVSPAQGAFLYKELGPWYGYYPRAGVGTIDSKAAGARSGTAGKGEGSTAGAEILGLLNQSLASLNTLYYRSDRFEIVDGEAGLLIPDEPQASPTENTYFTLAVLRERGTQWPLIVADAHLRHGEPFAVRCSLRMREKITDWRRKFPEAGVVLLGDMNHDRTSPVYPALIRGTENALAAREAAADPAARAPALLLTDSFDYATKPENVNWGNWHNFTGISTRPWPTDLIFFTAPLKLADHGQAALIREEISAPIAANTPPTGNSSTPATSPLPPATARWPSDHFFVMAVLEKEK